MDNKEKTIFDICEKIVSNRKQLIRLWKEVDHIKEHGVEPDVAQKFLSPAQDSLTIGQAVTIALNFPSWITRNKRRLEQMPESPERNVLEQEFAARSAALELVKSLRDQEYEQPTT